VNLSRRKPNKALQLTPSRDALFLYERFGIPQPALQPQPVIGAAELGVRLIMIRNTFFILLYLGASSAWGASKQFSATLISSDIVKDSGKTSLFFKVDSDNSLLDSFRILCDSDSHEAIRAWWMTKGMFTIHLPEKGLVLSPPLPENQPAKITFDTSTLKDASKSKVTILSIDWINTAEQGAAANP